MSADCTIYYSINILTFMSNSYQSKQILPSRLVDSTSAFISSLNNTSTNENENYRKYLILRDIRTKLISIPFMQLMK